MLGGPSPQPTRVPLGDAKSLLAPHIDLDRWNLPLGAKINYSDQHSYPVSEVARVGKNLEITVNLPGPFLASIAWEQAQDEHDIKPVRMISREILTSVQEASHNFIEFSYLALDKKEYEKDLKLDCVLSVVRPFPEHPAIGHISLRYTIPERQSLIAAFRIARSIGAMTQFCFIHGVQRTIEVLVDRAAEASGPLKFKPVDLPVSEQRPISEMLDESLPALLRPSEMSKGGSLGENRPLVGIYHNKLVLRIPSLVEPAEDISFYLNETELAQVNGIVSTFVDLPSQNPFIRGLIENLARQFSTEDSPYQPSPRRKEPGYWRIDVPLNPHDSVPGLKIALQFITTFREALRRGKPILPCYD